MKKTLIYRNQIFALLMLAAFWGCKKEDGFLNQKPNLGLAIPSSLNDLQEYSTIKGY